MESPAQLNNLLRSFYPEVRNKAGERYSKATLVGLRAGLQRHLTSQPFYRQLNFIADKEFISSNKVFIAVLKNLKAEKGDQTRHYPPISDNDLVKLRATNAFNLGNSTQLQEKVWFDLTLHFARRGRENARNLTADSFLFKTDDLGHEYVEMAYFEKTKNHQGTLEDNQRAKPRMYATPGLQNCPVNSLKLFLNSRNKQCDAFFQNPSRQGKTSNKQHTSLGYIKSPLGVNKIGQIMKNISIRLGLSKIYTNHSVRATTTTTLARAGLETRDIMKVTGHKNPLSVQSYNADLSEDQSRRISSILSAPGSRADTSGSSKSSSASSSQVHRGNGNVLSNNNNFANEPSSTTSRSTTSNSRSKTNSIEFPAININNSTNTTITFNVYNK